MTQQAKRAKYWIFGVIVILLIILFYPVKKISVERIQVTDVSDVSLRGFNLAGKLYINNPSIFTIPVEDIKYQLVLDKTGDVLFSGSMPGFELESRSTTTSTFTMNVQWRSTVNVALLMATQKEVNATMQGTAQLDVLGFRYEYPFESQMDLKAMLKNAFR